MSRKLILPLILLLFGVQAGLSQGFDDQKKKAEALKKEAVLFLQETALEVGTLRTLENRISFAAEIANLIWFHDEKEARGMFQTVIIDFRQLLIQTDSQFGASEALSADVAEFDLIAPANSSEKLLRKFRKAIAVRQQITLSIAEHDPQMAYDFFTSTSQAVANPTLRKEFESSDIYFEMKLANAIAEKDVDKALEAGRKRLTKGASFELIGLQKKIYGKDADKGIKFGEEIISKIKSDGTKSVNFFLFSSILSEGASNLDKIKDKPGKKPMFSESSLREVADMMAREILAADAEEGSQFISYLPQIERFSPTRAAMIRQKFKVKKSSQTAIRSDDDGFDEVSLDQPIATPVSIGNNEIMSREEFLQDAQKLADNQISKEEKEKIVQQARLTASKMASREMQIAVLSGLATQLFKIGDKEMAREIMNEARALVKFPPKNYKDFLGVWMLAGGYAQAQPDGAFPLLEDAILRLNETIAAMFKIGEFIDADEEIIEGDEVQVGAFGGSMARELLGALGSANPTIHALAVADFEKTKALTNRFDRTEVRILAKMLVLRAILGDKKVDGNETIKIEK